MMSFKVIVTNVGGIKTNPTDIEYGETPKVGELINMGREKVTAVRKGGDGVDEVEAQEQ